MEMDKIIQNIHTEVNDQYVGEILAQYWNYVNAHPEFKSNGGKNLKDTINIDLANQTLINSNELINFFNRDLMKEYMSAKGINISEIKDQQARVQVIKNSSSEMLSHLMSNKNMVSIDSKELFGIDNGILNHSLIINTDSANIPYVLIAIYNGLRKENLPFNIVIPKVSSLANGYVDPIRVNCSTELLEKTINVVNDVLNNIKDKIKTPSNIYASITDALGYESVENNLTALELLGESIVGSLYEAAITYSTDEEKAQMGISQNENGEYVFASETKDIDILNHILKIMVAHKEELDKLIENKIMENGLSYSSIHCTNSVYESIINTYAKTETNVEESSMSFDIPTVQVEPLVNNEEVLTEAPLEREVISENPVEIIDIMEPVLENNTVSESTEQEVITNIEPIETTEFVSPVISEEKIEGINEEPLVVENSIESEQTETIVEPVNEMPITENVSETAPIQEETKVVEEIPEPMVVPMETIVIPDETPVNPVETATPETVLSTEAPIQSEEARLDSMLLGLEETNEENALSNLSNLENNAPVDVKPLEENDLSKEEISELITAMGEPIVNTAGNTELIDRALKYNDIIDDLGKLNAKVSTPNGEVISLLDYLDESMVLEKIPVSSTVYLADGTYKTGAEFIRDYVIEYALTTNAIPVEDIIQKYANSINDDKTNNKEKKGFLKKLFGSK